MSSLLAAIEEVKAQIKAKEDEITPLRLAVNQLCKVAGIPEEYPDATMSGSAGVRERRLNWRVDHFFGRPLSTCVVEILETRKSYGFDGPTSIDDIYGDLSAGGYKFEGLTGNEDNSKRALKISLTKNTAQFTKVKEDVFGLKKWYNMRGPRRATSDKNADEAADENSIEEPIDESGSIEEIGQPQENN